VIIERGVSGGDYVRSLSQSIAAKYGRMSGTAPAGPLHSSAAVNEDRLSRSRGIPWNDQDVAEKDIEYELIWVQFHIDLHR
jgi:hypothetical protein